MNVFFRKTFVWFKGSIILQRQTNINPCQNRYAEFNALKILPVNEKGQDLKLTQGTYARHIEHSMKKHSQISLQVLDFLAPQQGLEPWTPWLTVRCSNQLSYWGIFCGMLRERLCRISVLRVQIYIKIFILPKVLAKKWRKRSDESSEPCTGSRRFSPGERRVAPCRTDKNKKETGAATSWYR